MAAKAVPEPGSGETTQAQEVLIAPERESALNQRLNDALAIIATDQGLIIDLEGQKVEVNDLIEGAAETARKGAAKVMALQGDIIDLQRKTTHAAKEALTEISVEVEDEFGNDIALPPEFSWDDEETLRQILQLEKAADEKRRGEGTSVAEEKENEIVDRFLQLKKGTLVAVLGQKNIGIDTLENDARFSVAKSSRYIRPGLRISLTGTGDPDIVSHVMPGSIMIGQDEILAYFKRITSEIEEDLQENLDPHRLKVEDTEYRLKALGKSLHAVKAFKTAETKGLITLDDEVMAIIESITDQARDVVSSALMPQHKYYFRDGFQEVFDFLLNNGHTGHVTLAIDRMLARDNEESYTDYHENIVELGSRVFSQFPEYADMDEEYRNALVRVRVLDRIKELKAAQKPEVAKKRQ